MLKYEKKRTQYIEDNPFMKVGDRVYEKTYNPLQGHQLIDTGVGGRGDLYQQAANELLRAQTAAGKAGQKYPEQLLKGRAQEFEMGAAEKLMQDKTALNALANLGMQKELGLGEFSPPGGGIETVLPKEPGQPGFIGPSAPVRKQPSATDVTSATAILRQLGSGTEGKEKESILDTLFPPGEPEVLGYTAQEKGKKKSFLEEFYKLPMAFSQ